MKYIDKRIDKLKKKLSRIGTRDFLGYVQVLFIPLGNDGKEFAKSCNVHNKTLFHSPMMQYKYLLGLLLSTDYDRQNEVRINDYLVKGLEKETTHLTDIYSKEFLKDFIKEIASNNKDEAQLIAASLENFLSYFNISSLRYPEQDINYLSLVYGNFDSKLTSRYSLNIKDFISFYNFIYDSVEKSMDEYIEIMRTINEKLGKPYSFESEEEILYYLGKYVDKNDLQAKVGNFSCVLRSKLIYKFGVEKTNSFIGLFSIERHNGPFRYYNEKNPFTSKPLVKIDEERYYVTYPTWLLDSFWILLNGDFKNDNEISKNKGDITEDLFLKALINILGDKATIYTNVCEQRGTLEHDILVLYGDYVLIIEVKSSKPREPFFDPQKSKQRLFDHFFSESGPGYAYNQAISLKKYLEKSDNSEIFINKTKKIVIENIKTKTIIPIVGTLEDFGYLSANPASLIKPECGQPYPWIINISDIENMYEIMCYLHLEADTFIKYIMFRINTQNDVFATDELDIFETYVDGFFDNYDKKYQVFLEPKGTSLIDKIYFNKKGVPYDY